MELASCGASTDFKREITFAVSEDIVACCRRYFCKIKGGDINTNLGKGYTIGTSNCNSRKRKPRSSEDIRESTPKEEILSFQPISEASACTMRANTTLIYCEICICKLKLSFTFT